MEDRTLLSASGGLGTGTYLPPQHHLFNYNGYLSGPSTAAPVAIAENYLRSHANDLGILPADLDNYIITTNYKTTTTGATTLTFEQSFHGMDVLNADYNITIAADGRILDIGGGFVPGLSARAGEPLATPVLNPQQAILAAAGALGVTPDEHMELIGQTTDGLSKFRVPNLSLDDITARLHYVAAPVGGVSFSWNLTVRTTDKAHWYNIDVDSTTGKIVSSIDYAHDASYEVIAIPNQNPDDSPRTIQTDPQIISPVPATVPSPFGWHDTNGAVGPEFTITRGNNVNAYADRNFDFLPDANSQPDGGPALDFSGALVPFDQTQAPSAYTTAAVTNLFYWTNVLHDVHYLYGFDEAARNFQVNNYGRGGIGNDSVNAEAQAGADTGLINNAFFATPPDGSAPLMAMFEFNITNPRRDGDFEPTIIVHEYGHGVSNRLTGNGSGLDALQSGGLGEGWSDWWSLMLTQKSASETITGRGVGTYVLGEPLSGLGIRDFRYKFNIANPQLETFLHYGAGPGQDTEVHSAGTRWTAALWDITTLFEQKYGFEPNVYNSTSDAGNIRALHLIMNALKIQPLNPTFIQARDAILLADQLLYGGTNQLEIWTAFARRGLGQFASTPNSDSEFLITSFVIPLDVQPRVAVSSVTQFEGDSGTTNFVFQVSFAGPLAQQATVEFATFNGTAIAGVDYLSRAGTLTFVPGGSRTQTVTVQVLGDLLAESDETFLFHLSNPTNAIVVGGDAIGTIFNDDIDLSVNDVTVLEGDAGTKNAVFTISESGTLHVTASVSYTTVDGSATAPSDFQPRAGAATFVPGGPTTINVTVPIVGDLFNESTENFVVMLTSPSSARIDKQFGIGTILDNDPLPSLYVNDVHVTTDQNGQLAAIFTVALDAPSGQDVGVHFETTDGVAQSGVNYFGASGDLSFAPGITTRKIEIPIVGSTSYSPDLKFFIDLSTPFHAKLADAHGVGTIIFASGPSGEFIIDNGDFGYSQTAGWTNLTNLVAYGLDYDYHAAGNGSGAATWTFGALQAGAYQVLARWVPFGNRATNAPFTIFDGGNSLGTVTVNEQLAPAGDQSNGVIWQSLGTFTTHTGTLAVRLNDNANGYVIADAIRIVAGGIAPQVPEMNVSYIDQSIATGDTSPTFSDGTDFGAAPASTGSQIHTFTINNNGNADLHLTGSPRVTIVGANPGDFTVLSQPDFTVAPGSHTAFQVMFHPTAIGLRQAVISIANDDASEHPYTFMVQGTGGAAGPTTRVIDDSAGGFFSTGDWTINTNSQSLNGALRTAPAGNGNSRASWTFASLAPGNYVVYTSWVPFGNRATNAPFTVSDGTLTTTNLSVNQQQTPDVAISGVNWRSLGTFNVSSGSLVVGLNNGANGFVAADAVMIVQQNVAPLALPAAHNAATAQDVNNDGHVSSVDALIVINHMLVSSATAVPNATPLAATGDTPSLASSNYYLDVNGDGVVSPLDALQVINYLFTASRQVQSTPTAVSAAIPAAQPSSAAVDQALGQLGRSATTATTGVAVSPASAVPVSSGLSVAAVSPPAVHPTMLTPSNVRAFFASAAKKSRLV